MSNIFLTFYSEHIVQNSLNLSLNKDAVVSSQHSTINKSRRTQILPIELHVDTFGGQIELSLISMRSTIGDSIGNGLTGDSVVTIQRYKCGDSDGDSFINIIDALAIARQVVGLPPPPSITPVADVNGNGDISIVDAMHIARYSVGLVVVGTCLIQ